MSELLIRPARPEDRDPVFAISATVWEGHDYLPQVWDRWIDERADRGYLLVVECDDQVVAIQHTAIQPMGVAWMEGIRVHPDFRQRGIAGRLLEQALIEAPRHGCRRARLSTASLNQASSKAAENNGFRQVADYSIFQATIESSDGQSASAAAQPVPTSVSDDDVIEARRLSGSTETMIIHQWTAYDLPGQRSAAEFPYSLKIAYEAGLDSVGLAAAARDADRLNIVLLEGSEPGMTELANQFRVLAQRDGQIGVSAMLPSRETTHRALSAAGYDRDDRMSVLVFERDL
jgi:GNAT superfamily N-acetyltransferase